ncbi:ethanolamine ammonia-lyase subunit EutC [Clostridium algidicarnis]|uniref:Ethanolamine ammonia-lyase small subunit n=2 Tax=Clostridium algidicarnis TaxID=37659 RepID=A0A2S6FXK5_9CLOT|nr:ethanolamine ammonia-lyase subunit EutC [Clostridium algidicarnis]MBB6631349.1 ethanolamine ammonia-lyase subunit EutC [Clostridium algidicarnis]MBB6697172.1 ethanolamine ammonia-lyase subunit EutC [Clostridium algidicarnis]MBU3192408.1 ethanolamine ammonia-lyase subunit EutC [Clostridium algidicarnis]MBU3204444.1 ethanolamine ammonia-lyase subunit EutC [Clostridium algidicarnis]MBU3206428.1 ethanolamine ammonia-lyase subunit EutC [Clostridium algidicarnis]
MFSESDLKRLVEQVLVEMTTKEGSSAEGIAKEILETATVVEDGMIPDITEVDIRTNLLVKNPADREGYLKMKKHTPARLGVGRAGARYKTETTLRFRADHAAAQDAVFTDVDEKVLEDMDLQIVKTMCSSKDEFITRPDLGRKISKEELDKLKSYKRNPQVQIYVSDGLSSKAIEANVKSILPALIQGLEGYGISVGKPFFVKLGRVGAMDVISEEFGADVTCVLIGERPGLVTAESMSAYIAYKGTIGMEESRRTVVSNIHRGGTPAVEAGAYIADIIKLMLEKKASGLDLKL